MLASKPFVSLLSLSFFLALHSPSAVLGQAYSTTFTTTTTATTTSFTPTVTETSSTTLADELTTTTTTVQTTLDALTTTTTTTLDALTSTVSLPAATETVVNTQCVEYALKFGASCCPTKYVHKKGSAHPHPHPHPHPSSPQAHPNLHPRVPSSSYTHFWPVARADKRTYRRRAISGPVPTTSSCSVSNFMDFYTSKNVRTPIVSAYDFGVGGRMRIQDLYAVNVCGDVYVDNVKVASTTCPALNGGDTSGNQNDPDLAISSGKYGYVYINVPAGVHTVEFMETYSGGQAFYQISSNLQCPALAYIDEQTTTVYATTTETTTKTVAPTSTQTDVITETNTNTPTAIVEVTTETPSAITTTVVPAPVQTHVNKCKKVTVNVACPSYKKQSMLDNFLLGQLQSTKKKNDNGQPLTVTCSGKSSTFEY